MPSRGDETLFGRARKARDMADDSEENAPADDGGSPDEAEGEEKSFRERVEEIRQKRAEEGEEGEGGRGPPEEMMGGGMGGGGGNPFAQMMGGMMGGGMGPGGGGRPGQEEAGNEELVREMRKLRDEVHDVRRSLDRIADALEDD
jgi:hypothetical protein